MLNYLFTDFLHPRVGENNIIKNRAFEGKCEQKAEIFARTNKERILHEMNPHRI